MKYLFKRISFHLYRLFFTVFFGKIAYLRKIGVVIGEKCRIYISDFGSEPFLIKIGNNVTITPGVKFINHNGSTQLISDGKGRRYYYGRISIGDNVFIGLNVLLLPGVIIGDNVIIAAGSVVTKSIPSNSVVGGNPAKIISSFEAYKIKSLETYPSKEDMDFFKSYKERVLNNVDKNPKPFLKSGEAI